MFCALIPLIEGNILLGVPRETIVYEEGPRVKSCPQEFLAYLYKRSLTLLFNRHYCVQSASFRHLNQLWHLVYGKVCIGRNIGTFEG